MSQVKTLEEAKADKFFVLASQSLIRRPTNKEIVEGLFESTPGYDGVEAS